MLEGYFLMTKIRKADVVDRIDDQLKNRYKIFDSNKKSSKKQRGNFGIKYIT